jgi:hypothetical protein
MIRFDLMMMQKFAGKWGELGSGEAWNLESLEKFLLFHY